MAKSHPLLEEPSLPKLASLHTYRANFDFETTKPGIKRSELEVRSKDTEALPGMLGEATGSYEDKAR